MRSAFSTLGLLSACVVVEAQAQSTQPLDTVTVSAPRLERELYATPRAVSVIDEAEIQRGQQRVRLDEALDIVPGVYLQNRNNFAQGLRVAIRGFGARAPFGVRGITVLVDGIPYTLPDGQAQLDTIDLDSAERIEVIRGPASVLYGNAAGGVIAVTTADGRDAEDTPSLRLGAGSHGYRKLSAQAGGSDAQNAYHLSVSGLDYAGYRDQSEVEKYLLNAKLSHRFDAQRELSAVVNLLENPRAEDPGGLNAAEVAADRAQAAPNSRRLDAGQEVDQQVLGLSYRDATLGPGELRLQGYYLRRDFEQQLPYVGDSLIGYDRDYFGGRAEYHQSLSLGELPLRYVAGLSAARQVDDRDRHDVNASGRSLGRSADETQTATSMGAFAQGDLELTSRLLLSLGARFDHVELEIDDDFDGNIERSGDRDFQEWSGSLGLSYRLRPAHQLYLNTATAFETPTFAEFANPAGTGGFNPTVAPQEAWNRELGLRGYFDNGLSYDLALFSTRVRDELLPYEGDSGRTFYRNAGDTDREGLELALDWQLTPAWRLESALTLARYEFERFERGGQNLAGNRLPGLPERVWVNQLTWEGLEQRFVALETQYNGEMYADNANDVKIDDYWLLHLRAGDGWRLGGDTLLKVYGGVRNLLDEEHFANVRINASYGRYYEPAPDRTFYAGLELSF